MLQHAIDNTVSMEHSINFEILSRLLFRHKKDIALCTAAFLFLAIATAFILPVLYTSTAAFIPPSTNSGSSIAAALGGQLATLGAGDLMGGLKNSGDLYAGIIKSSSIAKQLIHDFGLMDVYRVKRESDAQKILASNTVVTVDAKSTIVTIGVTAKTPILAQKLADAYLDALRATNGRLALSQSSQRRLFFEQQLAKEKDDLEDAEVALKESEERFGIIAPSGQTEAEIRTIADTQAQIAVRQVQLAALGQSATEQNPEVVRIRSEIADLQRQLANLDRGKGNGSITSIPASKVPSIQLEYVRRERDVKYHEALFEIISKQYEAARLDEARDAPVIQVLDPASYPDTKSSPKRTLIALGGAVFGFIVGCARVLTREYRQLSSAII